MEIKPAPVVHPDMSVTLVGGQTLSRTHPAGSCRGEHCCIHRPSDHHMAAWPQNFRASGMERICPHGIGHPDPDDLYAQQVHGCDGCCAAPDH